MQHSIIAVLGEHPGPQASDGLVPYSHAQNNDAISDLDLAAPTVGHMTFHAIFNAVEGSFIGLLQIRHKVRYQRARRTLRFYPEM
jgi:hypothetical protein